MDRNQIIKMIEEDQSIQMMRMERLVEKYALEPMGFSNALMKILMVIMVGGSISQKYISDHVATSPANISKRVHKMEKDGLIKRDLEGDKKDRRKVLISLTLKGERRVVKAMEKVAVIRSYMISKFTKEELEGMQKSMKKMNVILDDLEKNITQLFK